MKTNSNWVKCVDPSGKIRTCKLACSCGSGGVLSAWDMRKLGYVKCSVDDFHYLASAIRPCKSYEPEDMEPLPGFGHMTMEEFIKFCPATGGNGFIDYDGFAHYASKTEVQYCLAASDVMPSMVAKGEINLKWTHVVWYNR